MNYRYLEYLTHMEQAWNELLKKQEKPISDETINSLAEGFNAGQFASRTNIQLHGGIKFK